MASNHLMKCPYDPDNRGHDCLPGTYAYHLVRCRKSIIANKDDPRRARALKLTQCHYNITHIVPKTELDEHHKNCDSKIDDLEEISERIRRNLKAYQERGDKPKAVTASGAGADIEDWDMENGNEDHSPLQGIVNSEVALAKADGKILGAPAKPSEDCKPLVIRAKPAVTPAAAHYIPGLGEKGPLTKNQKKKAKRKTKKVTAGEN